MVKNEGGCRKPGFVPIRLTFFTLAKSTLGRWLEMSRWCVIKFFEIWFQLWGTLSCKNDVLFYIKNMVPKTPCTFFTITKSSLRIWMGVSRRCAIRFQKSIFLQGVKWWVNNDVISPNKTRLPKHRFLNSNVIFCNRNKWGRLVYAQ